MGGSGGKEKTVVAASAPGGGRPARKKRRHLRRLLIVLVVLVLIVGITPLLLSTGPGTRAILGLINARIKGTVHVDDLSVSWLGPCRVENVRVVDCDGREVVRVASVQYARGALGALLDAVDFGQVSVVSPRVTLYLDSRGMPSLAEALEPSRPRQPKAPRDRRLPAPKGTVTLTGGVVKVVFADKPGYELTDIQVELTLDTLDRLAGAIDFRTAGKGRVSIELDLSGLAADGKFGIGGATGSFSVNTPEPVALGPVLRLASGRARVGGAVRIAVQGDMKAGSLAADVEAGVAQLVWASPKAAGIRPIDLALTGGFKVSADELSGRGELTGEAGNVRAAFSAGRGQRLGSLSWEQIVEAVLGGRSIRLPDFALDAGGKIDLPRLSRAVPSLLKLVPNVEITSGRVVVKEIAIRGGERPSLRCSVTLEDLRARKGQTAVACRPISLVLDTALEPDAGLVINKISLRSAFAEADGNGRATDLKVSFWLDVPKFHGDLGKIFDLGSAVPRGRIDGRMGVARRTKNRVEFDLTVTAKDLLYRQAGRSLPLDDAGANCRGYLVLQDKRPVEVVVTGAGIDLGRDLSVSGSGRYRIDEKAVSAEVHLKRADLLSLHRRLKGFLPRRIGRVAATVSCRARITGDPNGAVDVSVSQGRVRGLQLLDDPITGEPAAPEGTMDLTFAGNLHVDAGKITGRSKVAGQGLSLDAGFVWPRGSSFDPRAALSALLDGGGVALPELAVFGQGAADLGVIRRAAPSLLAFSSDVSIVAGQVRIGPFEITGGRTPAAKVKVEVSGLVVKTGDRLVRLQPISAAMDVALDERGNLRVADGGVKTAFARLDLSGAGRQLQGDFAADLGAAREQIGRLLDLGAMKMSGRVNGRISLAHEGARRVTVSLTANGRKVHWASGERNAKLDDASLRSSGVVDFDGNGPVKVTVSQVQIALAGVLAAEGSGWYDLRNKGFEAKFDVRRGELAPLLLWGKGLRLPVARAEGYSGTVALRGSVARAAADEPLISAGSAVVRDLAVGGEPVGKSPVDLKWSGVKVYSGPGRIDAELVRLDSDAISLLAENVRLGLGKDIRPEGKFRLTADIAKCISAARPIVKWAKPPRVSGQFTGRWVCRQVAGGAQLTGSGGVRELRIEGDERTFTQKSVTFSHAAVLDQAAERITISKMELASDLLSFRLAGTVDRFRTERVLNLAGSYEGSWDDLTGLLHELSPGTRTTVLLFGKTGGPITVSGPAHRPKVRPAFRGLAAKTTVGWTRARFFGVDMGKAELLPTLDDGQVRLPVTVIRASDGNVHVGGTVDLRGAEPVFRLPGKVKLLDGVRITPQMSEEFLSRFNPVFTGLTDANGRVWLTTRDLVLPLGDGIKKSGSGSGHLDLSELEIRPKGVLKALVALAGPGAGKKQAVRVDGVDFVIRDGRIHYDNFTMVFSDVFDLKFYGSVGFDDTLEMAVSIPVSAALLEKFGARGPVVEYARLLKGVRVAVPLVGSRLKPRLDFAKVDIGPLIKRAVEALLSEQLGNILERILKSRLPDKNQPDGLPDPEDDANDDANDKDDGSLLDSLLDLLE